MKKLLYILVLITTIGRAQTWNDFKSRVKSESNKNKEQVAKFNIKQGKPKSFHDGENHFLLRAVYPSGKPIYLTTLNADAAITTGTSLLQTGSTGFSLNGNGKHIFQWDAGSVKPHIEFDNRVIANEGNTYDNHATHVGGILVAAGVNAAAKGMAPSANLHAYYYDDDLEEMAAQAEVNPYGFLISNHSYGSTTGWQRVSGQWQWVGDATVSSDEDYTAGYYSLRTKQIDELALLAPYYTIVWAAGNDRGDVGTGSHPPDCNGGTGYDCIIQEGVAKNIITVGAVNKDLNYTGPSSVVMSNFSSWGPTDDGRIKPDVVAAGVSLFSTSANGTDGYQTMSGTSMATPNTSGSLLLLQELYGKMNGGKWMKASTLKALAIHTTKEAGPSPGPDYSFGWGLLDVSEAARLISIRDDENVFIVEGELKNGQIHEWQLNPLINKKITATLVWSDPAGLPPGAVLDPPYSMLINDLDVRLIDNNNVEKFPWILSPGSPASAATRGDNTRDNVEKLEFDFPNGNPYRLQVKHKGYLVGGSQHYSMIITYASQSTSKNLYWVGGSGNWNDANHWSLTSGGSSSGAIPNANDKVIVDENSFGSSGDISLPNDVSCQSLKWWCSKQAGIDFSNHKLGIGKVLTIASNTFQKNGNGQFDLNSLDSGMVYVDPDLVQSPNITVSTGKWKMSGDLSMDTLLISGGELQLLDANVKLDHFIAQSSNTKLKSVNSKIELNNSWISDESKINIESDKSSIVLKNGASLQSKNLSWNGLMQMNGQVSLSGTIAVDSLSIMGGTSLSLVNSCQLIVNRGVNFLSNVNNPINITSSGSATFQLNQHKKYCQDYLNVSKVNLTGQSVVILGVNSSLANSMGWLQQACDQILFPDFDAQYVCVNGRTEFANLSSGPATSFQWDFGDVGSAENESASENGFHQYKQKGSFDVTLTVSGGGKSASYTKSINILHNTLPLPEINYNSDVLFSSVSAEAYQWIDNGDVLVGETNRTYNYQGTEGLYQLVVYDKNCNNQSAPLLISGIEKLEASLGLFPVPASEKIYFTMKDVDGTIVYDVMGRNIPCEWSKDEQWLDVSKLPNGTYHLTLLNAGKRVTKRLIVMR